MQEHHATDHAIVRLAGVMLAGLVGACNGGQTVQRDDANPAPDAEGGTSIGTDVMGALGGIPFRLRHAVIERGAYTGDPGDPIKVCAANIEVTFTQCEYRDGPDRVLFVGAFDYRTDGTPFWGKAETLLVRVGANPMTRWLDNGTLNVVQDDPVGGALQITFSADFREVPITTGSIAVQ